VRDCKCVAALLTIVGVAVLPRLVHTAAKSVTVCGISATGIYRDPSIYVSAKKVLMYHCVIVALAPVIVPWIAEDAVRAEVNDVTSLLANAETPVIDRTASTNSTIRP
jgi:hypothetical protein